MEAIQHSLTAMLLVSMRVVPTLVFAQPFSLVRMPATIRLALCLMIAAWLVAGHPEQTTSLDTSDLFSIALSELLIGIALALTFQLAFAAVLTVGRAIDIQAGYAFAMLADPTSRAQLPLIGTIFAYATAIIFFATDGPANLLAIWSLSLESVPLGASPSVNVLAILISYVGSVFVLALGSGALLLLVLLLIDSGIALLSRTLPQMNVLVLGFQAKAIGTLILLPIALAGSAALFLQVLRFALDTMLRFF